MKMCLLLLGVARDREAGVMRAAAHNAAIMYAERSAPAVNIESLKRRKAAVRANNEVTSPLIIII